MTTGEKIRSARIQAGLTQGELAERIGLRYQSISQWERGIRTPTLRTLRLVSSALGIEWENLLDDKYLLDDEPNQVEFSRVERLNRIIAAKGISRRELAFNCEISPSTLQSAIDRAEKTDGNISLDILYPISRFLCLPMWVFVCDSDDLRFFVSAMSGDLEEEKT